MSELFIAEAQLTTALTQRWRNTHESDKGEPLVPSYFFPLTSKNIRWDLLVWHLANGKVRGECVTARGKVWRAHHTHKHTPLRSLLWSASLKFPLRHNDIWPKGFTLQVIASIRLASCLLDDQLPNFLFSQFVFYLQTSLHEQTPTFISHVIIISTHRKYWFWQLFLSLLLVCYDWVYVHLQTDRPI